MKKEEVAPLACKAAPVELTARDHPELMMPAERPEPVGERPGFPYFPYGVRDDLLSAVLY